MRSTRTVRPTDIVALVTFDGRVYRNEARPWERMGKSFDPPHPLESALEQWFSFATGKHTWVNIQGQTLRGLVCARQRGTRRAWEIDTLLAAGEDQDAIAEGLLEQVTDGAVAAGVHKLFLRMDRDSRLLDAARRAGFRPYLVERLLRRNQPAPRAGDEQPDHPGLRKRTRADSWGLFQLYNRATPEPVRREEALTFDEWRASQENRASGRGRQNLVLEADGQISGWLRTQPEGKAGRMDILVHGEAPERTRMLVDQGLAALAGRAPIFALVPVYLGSVIAELHRRDFGDQGEFIVLAKRLAVPAHQTKPVPAAAAVKGATFVV